MMELARADAELFAAQALAWLSADSARLSAFMAASGSAPGDLRRAMADSAFLLGVIDFVMADEAMLLACCADLDLPPDHPARARAALPGGTEAHWT